MSAVPETDLTPPESVAAVAKRALEMRAEQTPSNQGGTPVGVKRANQLANRERLSADTIRRMVSFFARHEIDKQAEGFNRDEKGFPSKGRQAWDLWGGDPGRAWAEKMAARMNQKESTEMIDVNVLTGADIRRIDGKYGKISKVSLPWVTVEWSNGERMTYRRSDEALSEDIELKTLDKGWIPLGSVVGIEEGNEQDALLVIDESETPTSRLLHEIRVIQRRLSISEASQKTKDMMKRKAKAKKASAKKAAPKKEAPKSPKGRNAPNGTNPFYRFKTIGVNSPKKKKRSQKKIWTCTGSAPSQCTALKDVPSQGIKKGQKKTISLWAGKKKWTKDYEAGREDGKYKLPNGGVEKVVYSQFKPA